MKSLYNDDDLDGTRELAPDREISLGTSMVLGIFFALAIVCALFFAFGYTMGRRSAQTALTSNPAVTSLPETTVSKPSAANSNSNAHPARTGNSPGDASASTEDTDSPAPASPPREQISQPPARTSKVSAAPPEVTPSVPGTGVIVVQVAAVSHPEDAGVLVSALKQKGYDVSVRRVPTDKLLHIQIGPFATKKEADAMRQRLLADGYNAILK